MATKQRSTKSLIRAAGYIRMSSGKQERSPAQQKGEINKLAKVERCRVDLWFSDEAITGDSGPEQRPGFRDLLEAAERGEFEVLLVENGDRIGRFDSLAGAAFYNRLRAAGIRIVTCSDGEIDLDTFEGRVVHTVRQEGRHAFLRDLSRKVTRGQIANAKAGHSNGAPPKYGMDRALIDPSGEIVRRLAPGETVRIVGHHVCHVPSEDKDKLAALLYMFKRFADSQISYRALAFELNDKGFPSPRGAGWGQATVSAILRNPIYRGTTRWGARTAARYHTNQGDSIVAVANGKGHTRKPIEDAIQVNGGAGIIPARLFDRVQRKVAKRCQKRTGGKASYPLSGLIVCGCCGQPMHGSTISRKDRNGQPVYSYPSYLCPSYNARGARNATGCGHFRVGSDAIQQWLTRELQKAYRGLGREELVLAIKRELRSGAKTGQGDANRLEKRAGELDQEVGRLVKAIRTTDIPELAQELADAKAERDRIKVSLSQISHHKAPGDIHSEAERIADRMMDLADRLTDGDPGVLKEVFGRMVSRITCQWGKIPAKNGRTRVKLIGGKVELLPLPVFVPFANHAKA